MSILFIMKKNKKYKRHSHFATVIAFVRSLIFGWIVMCSPVCFVFNQIEKLFIAIGADFGGAQIMNRLMFFEYFLLAEHFRALFTRIFLGAAVPIVMSLERALIFHLFLTYLTCIDGLLIIRLPAIQIKIPYYMD